MDGPSHGQHHRDCRVAVGNIVEETPFKEIHTNHPLITNTKYEFSCGSRIQELYKQMKPSCFVLKRTQSGMSVISQ